MRSADCTTKTVSPKQRPRNAQMLIHVAKDVMSGKAQPVHNWHTFAKSLANSASTALAKRTDITDAVLSNDATVTLLRDKVVDTAKTMIHPPCFCVGKSV